MSIESTKEEADKLAEIHAGTCRRWFLRDPIGGVMKAAAVKVNTKFFRRMAGLRNGDLK